MALERCPSGHLYDPAKHTACPYCGVSELDLFSKTSPRRPVPEPHVDEPEVMRTRPKGEKSIGGTDPGATQPFFRNKMGLDPVVGWLVCVDGRDRGRDYRIRGENNFIGRSETMSICIGGDDGISRENHAVITFDPKTSLFKLSPGDARGMVYLNGEAVYSPVDLSAHDQIQLGNSQFRFIPLCGDRFQWT